MSTFKFLVAIYVTNDMQGESGQDFAQQELEGDLRKLPHNATVLRCDGEADDESELEEQAETDARAPLPAGVMKKYLNDQGELIDPPPGCCDGE